MAREYSSAQAKSLLNEYNLLGMLYSDEGRQLEAIDCYEKAATFLDSASNTIQAKVYYNLADQLFSLSAENREKRKDWEDEALRYSMNLPNPYTSLRSVGTSPRNTSGAIYSSIPS